MGGLVVSKPHDRGKLIDKRIRDAGCFTVTHQGGFYFFPRNKLPAEIYRLLKEDIELRLELRLFLLKQTVGIQNGD